jgi:DNA repair protein RecN (Recombination protein N)
MLRHLVVADFAIIEHAELEFGPGLTALTGETGAGKSLLVDALLMVGGARADSALVRHGAGRAEVGAEFDLSALPDVRAWLAGLELDDGNECRVRRVLRPDGSSRAFVNDRGVSVATLRELGERLVEIHGQHEHQALLSRTHQLALLDAFGGHDAELASVRDAFSTWQRLEEEARALRERAGRGGQAVEFLRFQLDELARHALTPESFAELEHEHGRLAHAGELIEVCTGVHEALDGDDDGAARTVLARAVSELERMAHHDAQLAPILDVLRSAEVQAVEAAEALDRYRSAQELDPDRLAALDAQLGKMHELARKHRVPAQELKARESSLRAEYDALAGAEERLAGLDGELAGALAIWRDGAGRLGAARAKAAATLATRVTALMAELGMQGGRFEVQIETDVAAAPAACGAEQVEFLVGPNPGQPPRPLRRIASGGELSRIGLAIEVAALGKDSVGSMVFDEVDAGVGGAVAEVLGRKLKALGTARQVLCVTHLPQVAAQADRHIAVDKRVERGATRTRIEVLDAERRREELARMLGGIEITAQTRAHAEDMLQRARAQGPGTRAQEKKRG